MTFERESSTDVAVVIPAWNEAEDIEATVSTLSATGSPSSGDRASSWWSMTPVMTTRPRSPRGRGATTLKVEKRQIAAVRNAGAAATDGSSAGLRRCRHPRAQRDVARVDSRGRGRGPRSRGLGWRCPACVHGSIGSGPGCCFGRWRTPGCFRGVVLVMRREIFDAVDGFDEQWFASEELWLVKSIRALGRGAGHASGCAGLHLASQGERGRSLATALADDLDRHVRTSPVARSIQTSVLVPARFVLIRTRTLWGRCPMDVPRASRRYFLHGRSA